MDLKRNCQYKRISLQTDPMIIEKVVRQYIFTVSVANFRKGAKVYINGKYCGNTTKIQNLLHTVRSQDKDSAQRHLRLM